jgi:hypothetical protein
MADQIANKHDREAFELLIEDAKACGHRPVKRLELQPSAP